MKLGMSWKMFKYLSRMLARNDNPLLLVRRFLLGLLQEVMEELASLTWKMGSGSSINLDMPLHLFQRGANFKLRVTISTVTVSSPYSHEIG